MCPSESELLVFVTVFIKTLSSCFVSSNEEESVLIDLSQWKPVAGTRNV